MIGDQYQDIVSLGNAVISAVSHEGLTVQLINGKPATLAVIDPSGKIYEAGSHVCEVAWQTSIASYRRFLIGKGHLRIYSAEDSIRMQLGRARYC